MEQNKQINSLQGIINKRAKERLEKDLKFLEELYILNNWKYKHLCEGIKINRGTIEKPDVCDVIFIFKRNSRVGQELYDNNIEKYIKEETELFIKEIENLKQKNEEIENRLEDLSYEVNR